MIYIPAGSDHSPYSTRLYNKENSHLILFSCGCPFVCPLGFPDIHELQLARRDGKLHSAGNNNNNNKKKQTARLCWLAMSMCPVVSSTYGSYRKGPLNLHSFLTGQAGKNAGGRGVGKKGSDVCSASHALLAWPWSGCARATVQAMNGSYRQEETRGRTAREIAGKRFVDKRATLA